MELLLISSKIFWGIKKSQQIRLKKKNPVFNIFGFSMFFFSSWEDFGVGNFCGTQINEGEKGHLPTFPEENRD